MSFVTSNWQIKEENDMHWMNLLEKRVTWDSRAGFWCLHLVLHLHWVFTPGKVTSSLGWSSSLYYYTIKYLYVIHPNFCDEQWENKKLLLWIVPRFHSSRQAANIPLLKNELRSSEKLLKLDKENYAALRIADIRTVNWKKLKNSSQVVRYPDFGSSK